MKNKSTEILKIFAAGFITGVIIGCATAGFLIFRDRLSFLKFETLKFLSIAEGWNVVPKKMIIENFDSPVSAAAQKPFGKKGQLTFELYRNGTFDIDGKNGYAYQKSASYRDSAYIRNTVKLPKTYKISIVVSDIDYNLEKINKLPRDPEYPEGPGNENGCYLLAITDTKPEKNHTNIWWHQHRKLVIDVDNNVWGHGMPSPIFMVYFDRSNRLVSYDGERNEWIREWRKAVTYDPKAEYRIEVEKTNTHFILSILDSKGTILKMGRVKVTDVWSEDGFHKDEYFVVGDPHENYYQGSVKIKSIAFTPTQ
ncbi:MAG: hypothetical protein JNN05_01285 [Candidatus Omnitrophica bacterium]|nr:hypothetical protein [Candidatus Omnitrophota bacterium]